KDIEPVVLNITKTDDQGNALTGSCFSVYDGDKVAGQACDTDDGEDGVTQIRFSLGVGNGLQLAESSTPDGQPVAEPQDVDLGPGVNNITVTAGGGGIRTTDTPTDVNVSLQMQDADGNPIVGGCLQLGDLGEQCDDDNDGTITFENVPANQSYDLTETQTPDGFEPFAGGTVDVGDSDMQYPVPHAAVGGGVGNLTLYTVDENGNPVPNVCYDITGVDGVQCDEDGDGDMGLTELPAGQYGAKQNSVPDGYTLDEQEQSVVVEGGAEAQLTFTSPTAQAQTFQVTIQSSDDQGNAAGGACYAVLDSNGNQVADACDDGSGSGASFTLPNGDYALTVTSVPDGYTTPDNVSFSVQDADTSVSVTLPIVTPEDTATEEPAEETPTETVEAASDTGTINITVTDADGFAIIGACVQIEGASSGEICDNGDGDGNSEDGFIQVQNLPDGDYTVSVSQLPEGFDPAQPVSVTIADGGAVDAQLVSGVTEPTETPAPETGGLLIRKLDANRDSLAGSCFALLDADGNQVIEVCDNDDNDTDSRDGRITIADITPGNYTLTETTAPDGYTPGDDQSITITAGETTRINIINQQALGTVVVTTSDGTSAIGGVCYELSGINQFCDDDGDGTITIDSVPPGDYTLTQISVPDGYTLSDPVDQAVTVSAGAEATIAFTVAVATATITVNVVDSNGNPVTGSCLTIDGSDPFCDDGSAVFTFNSVAPGDHTIAMSTTPDGYSDGGSLDISVASGDSATLTFTLAVSPGRIDIVTQDADGNRLGGACYAINGGDPICDNDGNDGNSNDGVIRVSNLTPGDYTLTQTQAPAGYAAAADQTFTVNAGLRTRIDVTLALLPGSVTVNLTNSATGDPIADGVCIQIPATADGTVYCDNDGNDSNADAGSIQIAGFAPGDYELVISSTVSPYVLPQATFPFTITAGEDVAVDI
ncbi:MAG TPA: SpaA isopeptide-forming pilin-related protein, partial [Thermomicrobiales bacterium]|nr:SpaA isopeptide-forming pilin-related protein [Thermomicrobiales bacterium]